MRTLHLLYIELIVIGVCLFYIQDTHMCLIYKVARFIFIFWKRFSSRTVKYIGLFLCFEAIKLRKSVKVKLVYYIKIIF